MVYLKRTGGVVQLDDLFDCCETFAVLILASPLLSIFSWQIKECVFSDSYLFIIQLYTSAFILYLFTQTMRAVRSAQSKTQNK